MLRGGVRGLLGILAFVDPPGMAKAVLLPTVGHELPDSPRPRARKRQRLERAFRLRQVDQVLRHALFPQNAGNHLPVAPGAPLSSIQSMASSKSLRAASR